MTQRIDVTYAAIHNCEKIINHTNIGSKSQQRDAARLIRGYHMFSSRSTFNLQVWLAECQDQDHTDFFRKDLIPFRSLRSDLDLNAIYQLFATENDDKVRIDMLKLLVLITTYPDIDISYIRDLLAIYQFLRAEALVDSHLDELEQALQAYAETSPAKTELLKNPEGKYYLANVQTPSGKCHKLLSGYLYAWAKEQGFTNKAKIIASLTPQVYQSLLTSKSIFKDASPDLLNEHGQWSHILQWWCIFKHQESSAFMQHPAMDMFQQFGRQSDQIWIEILDKGIFMSTYNSPEHVTIKILDNRKRWPLLYGTIAQQYFKMRNNDYTDKSYESHINRKHGKVPDDVIRRTL